MYYGKIKNDHIISDRIVYLTTLCNSDCSPFDIQKTVDVIMASFHDKDNAHKFLTNLSIHTLTNEKLMVIAKKAFSNIYEDDLSIDHRVNETIIDFADDVSYHLIRIADIYKNDATYIAYVIVFNSIKLFTYESDVTIFALRLMDRLRDYSIYEYVGNCVNSFRHMKRMVPSDKINMTLDVMETPNKEGVKYREEED